MTHRSLSRFPLTSAARGLLRAPTGPGYDASSRRGATPGGEIKKPGDKREAAGETQESGDVLRVISGVWVRSGASQTSRAGRVGSPVKGTAGLTGS